MFDFIHQLPLWSAKVGAVLLFLIVLTVTWLIPKSFIYSGAPDMKRWRDLRVWATLLILLQFLIYAVF
jgi:cytosine/uracil/thiamine/allantoin permease